VAETTQTGTPMATPETPADLRHLKTLADELHALIEVAKCDHPHAMQQLRNASGSARTTASYLGAAMTWGGKSEDTTEETQHE